jgi:hypothetical protein
MGLCNCRKNNYTQQQYKCKCKKFECVNVNDLHLHVVYMVVDTYTHNTHLYIKISFDVLISKSILKKHVENHWLLCAILNNCLTMV